jgi:hypothetical protein
MTATTTTALAMTTMPLTAALSATLLVGTKAIEQLAMAVLALLYDAAAQRLVLQVSTQ